MGDDNLSNNDEADTGSLFLGSQKRFEGIDVQRDTGAGIRDVDKDTILTWTYLDVYLTAAGHGLRGILNQVEQSLFDLVPIDGNDGRRRQ